VSADDQSAAGGGEGEGEGRMIIRAPRY
jgi:hypothetical protein